METNSAAACWGAHCSRDKTEWWSPIDAQEKQQKPTAAMRKMPFVVPAAARGGGGKGQESVIGLGWAAESLLLRLQTLCVLVCCLAVTSWGEK